MAGASLTIAVDSQGQLTVSGNVMGNKIIALGMLRLAEKVIENFQEEAQGTILLANEIPGDGMLPFRR